MAVLERTVQRTSADISAACSVDDYSFYRWPKILGIGSFLKFGFILLLGMARVENDSSTLSVPAGRDGIFTTWAAACLM